LSSSKACVPLIAVNCRFPTLHEWLF
jgi:hypothetical protein